MPIRILSFPARQDRRQLIACARKVINMLGGYGGPVVGALTAPNPCCWRAAGTYCVNSRMVRAAFDFWPIVHPANRLSIKNVGEMVEYCSRLFSIATNLLFRYEILYNFCQLP